ncbi:MAG TPA: aquaporin [Candidatus Polarisedimenticolaceae bacterium]|nr:aquaporin [Candidatus Polarisedimenticolaceae bacterium]
MNKYLTEFIGTFFLVLTIGCTVLSRGTGIMPPLAIGAVLMVMVYAGGHISGAHYNPAVTLGVWIRGRCPTTDLAPYWLAQIIGAFVASFAVRYLVGASPDTSFVPHTGPAFLAEFLFAFALVYVVLNVATARSAAGNSYYGLAIGFTVMAGAFSIGPISGGAMNPAVAIGASAMHLIDAGSVWIHIVADMLAGAVAALTFKFFNPDDK